MNVETLGDEELEQEPPVEVSWQRDRMARGKR
jgi:hypothetical protein